MHLALVTLLGHSVDNFRRLYHELRPAADSWRVVHSADMPAELSIDCSFCTYMLDVLPDGWDAGRLRTQAVQNSSGVDWFFHIDSDEWMTRGQLFRLRESLQHVDAKYTVVHIPRRNVGPPGDWLGWPDLRPMVHRPGITWHGRVEEYVTDNLHMVALDAVPDNALLHLQFDRDTRLLAQARRNDAKCHE